MTERYPTEHLEDFGDTPQSTNQGNSNENGGNIDDNVIIGDNISTKPTTSVDNGFLGQILRVMGMDTGKIGALAVNGLIFIAQMVCFKCLFFVLLLFFLKMEFVIRFIFALFSFFLMFDSLSHSLLFSLHFSSLTFFFIQESKSEIIFKKKSSESNFPHSSTSSDWSFVNVSIHERDE